MSARHCGPKMRKWGVRDLETFVEVTNPNELPLPSEMKERYVRRYTRSWLCTNYLTLIQSANTPLLIGSTIL